MAATDSARRWIPLVALACVPALGHADDRAALSTYVYTDTDGLMVVHPSASAGIDAGEDTRVELRYDADVITSATVDVRTSASVRPFEETRHGGSAFVMHSLARTVGIGGGYALSISPDYQSHTLSLRGALEDDARVHTLTLDVRGSGAIVGRVGDPEPTGELYAWGASASWAFVIARWLVADISAALEWNHGYQESPYRFVPIRGDAQGRLAVPEEVPDERVRTALAARLRAALDDRVFGRASYRLHADDWGVLGHTVELGLTFEPVRELSIDVGGRVLVQRGASFYRGTYYGEAEVPRLRTLDRELAPAWNGSAMAALRWRLPHIDRVRLSVALRGELLYFRYFDTPRLPERVAVVSGLSLAGEM